MPRVKTPGPNSSAPMSNSFPLYGFGRCVAVSPRPVAASAVLSVGRGLDAQ
jgi:hypothetical protein